MTLCIVHDWRVCKYTNATCAVYMMSLITIAEDCCQLSGGQIAGIVIGCVVGVTITIHVLAAVISLVRTMF